LKRHFEVMQDIWGRRTESGLSAEELREELCLHLARNLGEPHIAFSDQDGWAGKSREPGPPVDVMVVPPEGERRFAYVCSFGSAMKKGGDSLSPGGKARMEFALAVPQKGDAAADLAMLNMAANTVRQFAKLVHIQSVRVSAGETVQFARDPKPMFEDSKQVAFAFTRPRLPAQFGPMVLDALIYIKNEIDPTLTFRRSAVPRGRVRFVLDEHRRPQHLACTKGWDELLSGATSRSRRCRTSRW
jgi:hypothetical protein